MTVPHAVLKLVMPDGRTLGDTVGSSEATGERVDKAAIAKVWRQRLIDVEAYTKNLVVLERATRIIKFLESVGPEEVLIFDWPNQRISALFCQEHNTTILINDGPWRSKISES